MPASASGSASSSRTRTASHPCRDAARRTARSRDTSRPIPRTRPPAVLVGHSMGGMVITQAAANCPEYVDRLVYVAAFLPADGQSLIDLTQLPEGAGDAVQANLVVDGDPPVATMPPEAAREGLLH